MKKRSVIVSRRKKRVCSFQKLKHFRIKIDSDFDPIQSPGCAQKISRLHPRATPAAPYPPPSQLPNGRNHNWDPISPTQTLEPDEQLRPSQGAIVPFQPDEPGGTNQGRRQTYLITYSQADLERFPTRSHFSEAVLEAFQSVPVAVEKYAVSLERHKRHGMHFHMSVKVSKQIRFKQVGEYLRKKFNINVNFSTEHTNYYTAFHYVRQEDPDTLLSPGHEQLLVPPRTSAASAQRQKPSGEETSRPSTNMTKRLRKEEVALIILENKIRTPTELDALASKLRQYKDDDRLWKFITGYSDSKTLLESLIRVTWRLENAPAAQARAEKSRMEILTEAKATPCVCESQWKRAAKEILRWNQIPLSVFQEAVITAIKKGRGKGRNVMLIGRANCGKTFIFQPLTKIYDCFESPASGSFAWVGVEQKELVFLNDYRWTQAQIPWANFLTFLEGATTQIPAPKTSREKDIEFTRDVPVFATAQRRVMYEGERSRVMGTPELLTTWRQEQEMMDVRWKVFELTHPIENREEIKVCPKCFADFILDEANI